MKEILDRLLAGGDLGRDGARDLLGQVVKGALTPAQVAGFLVALRAKGPSAAEIAGFAEAMREAAVRIAPRPGRPLVDTSGTGGAPVRTFSFSTSSAFVVAASGAAVAKHGNRSHASSCGSADLVEALGVPLDLSPERVRGSIEKVHVGFLFAPLFHPAMKQVVPVRRELGISTLFNLLGPLTNPAGVRRQVVGVFDPALVPLMARALAELGAERAFVVHGAPGMDEVSLSGPTKVARVEPAGTTEFDATPGSLGLPKVQPDEVGPLPPGESAEELRAILSGKKGPRRDMLVANAAFGLAAAGIVEEPADGVAPAAEAIDSGKALERLRAFVAWGREGR